MREEGFRVDGFSPRVSTAFEKPNPGFMSKMLTTNDTDYDTADIFCDIFLNTQLINSYEEYEKFIRSDYIFASKNDEMRNDKEYRDRAVAKLFQEGGQIVLYHASCITHSVHFNPNNIEHIDEHFLNSLIKLASYPNGIDSDFVKNSVKAFVSDFGTHYTKRRFYGASIMVEVRFATKLKPELMAKLDATVKQFFSNKNVTKTDIMQSACDEAMDTCAYPVIKVVAKGTLPEESFRNWKTDAAEHPTVVKVEVEKITSLLKFKNFGNMIRKALLRNTSDDAINHTQRDYEQIERILSFHDYLHIEEPCPKPGKTSSLLYMISIIKF